MKILFIAVAAVALIAAGGCATTGCCCFSDEVTKLKEKKHIVICKCGEIKNTPNCCSKTIPKTKNGFQEGSFRDKLLVNANALNLTSEEKAALRKKKTVIFCGDCGHIKGMKDCCKKGAKINESTGFAEASIRNRILGPYTD